MITGITEIYNDVLSILPYSVIGHIELEKKLNDFYEKFVETNYIKYNPKYTFLSSAILNLPINNNPSQSYQQLHDWNLGGFKEIFYKTFVEGDKEEALSFYFYLCSTWAKKKLHLDSGLSTSSVLSQFFTADLDFRVGLIRDTKATRPNVRFDKRKNLFEINIPISLFKHTDFENLIHLRLELNKIWFQKEKYIARSDDTLGRLYKLNIPENCLHFEEIFSRLFIEDKIDDIIEVIATDYLKEFSKFNLYEKNEVLFKQVAYCAICLSFLCLYYECNIEYMLSVSKVEYKHLVLASKPSKPFYRNIGGLIIGYKDDCELTMEERAIFNIVSDRLAAVVGGQYLFQQNKEYQISASRKLRKQLYQKLDKADDWDASIDDLLHERNNSVYCETQHKNLKSFITENETFFKVINTELLEGVAFNKRLKTLLDGTRQDLYKQSKLFLKNITEFLCYTVHVNISLLDSLFKQFEEDQQTKEVAWEFGDLHCFKIKIVNNNKPFSKDSLLNKIERGISEKGFLGFLQSNRDALLCNGNLLVEIDGNIIFDLEKHTVIGQLGSLQLTEEFSLQDDFASNSFTLIFQILDE